MYIMVIQTLRITVHCMKKKCLKLYIYLYEIS